MNKDAQSLRVNSADTTKPDPLLVIDGKVRGKMSYNKSHKNLDNNFSTKPDNIKSINILKGDEAVKKYGEKGKDGVIEITLKNSKQGSLKPVKTTN